MPLEEIVGVKSDSLWIAHAIQIDEQPGGPSSSDLRDPAGVGGDVRLPREAPGPSAKSIGTLGDISPVGAADGRNVDADVRCADSRTGGLPYRGSKGFPPGPPPAKGSTAASGQGEYLPCHRLRDWRVKWR